MKFTLTGRAILGILFVLAALIGTPIAVFQLQQQQDIRQRADTTIAWATNQAALSSCPVNGSGAIITVGFKNTEPDRSYYSMNVIARDRQTGKTVNMGAIRGGEFKTAIIQTDRPSIGAGTVDFSLTWTDGHSGRDSRTATYNSISNCYVAPPTPTPTVYYPSPTVPYPSASPTPTICPTLGPVKNVKIDCPNCPK